MQGGLVVAPTETRYGLLARADQGAPLEKLYRLKGRPDDHLTAVFAGNREQMTLWANLNSMALRLARQFLPGPLTLVVPAVGTFPDVVVREGKIGLRLSSSPVIQQIMQNIDFPVSATSANISGEATPESVDEIVQLFGSEVDLYLNAGRLGGPVSTVVDCCGPEPVVLREGAVGKNDIEAAVKAVSR